MPPSLSGATHQVGSILKHLSAGKKIALIGLVGATIAGFAFLMIWSGNPDFEVLFANMAPEDAGAVLNRVKEMRIPYRIASNGSAILVPKDRLYETRMELASKGLPQGSGIGFEIFDDTKLGVTDFVQNVNYQRALQGELSRTINGFDEVESSRLHIVMASRSLFIDQDEPARASVVLKMRTGKWLSREQVQGVVHLVSSSISGLTPENVTVVDNNGRLLAGPKDKSVHARASADQLEYQETLRKSLESRVISMLDKALGEGRAVVRLSCALDFTRSEKMEERFYPDNRVIRSEQSQNSTSSAGSEAPSGTAGVFSNPSQKDPGGSPSGKQAFLKQDQTVNYEIGKVTSRVVDPVGRVERISVAVLVDGTYKIMEDKNKNKEKTYVPRTREELDKIENLVKHAVGFVAGRGDQVKVINIPFEAPSSSEEIEEAGPVGWIPDLKPYFHLARYGVSLFLILLAFIFVVRPLVQWLTRPHGREIEIFQQLPKTVNEIEREFGGGVKSLPFKDLASQLISNDNKASVELMREWLKEK